MCDKYLDKFTDTLDEDSITMDHRMKNIILAKAMKKINRRKRRFITAVAACFLLVILSSLIPNTPVYALRENLFSFIPGMGVIKNGNQADPIVSVLEQPLLFADGDSFFEVRTAYATSTTLYISTRTNIGMTDRDSNNDNIKEEPDYAYNMPPVYLLDGSNKIKPDSVVRSGPALVDNAYDMIAGFSLPGPVDTGMFHLDFEGFNKSITLAMSPVVSGNDPTDMGNVVRIGEDLFIFADVQRQGDTVKVLTSIVAPGLYNSPRLGLLPLEETLFESVHILDEDGRLYMHDDKEKKDNGYGINSFYFDIPRYKKGLQIVIPQMLYTRGMGSDGIQIDMRLPETNKEVNLGDEILLGDVKLIIEKASIVPAGDPLLPEYFESFDNLRIDAAALLTEGTSERVYRIRPGLKVQKGWLFERYWETLSSSGYADMWSLDEQRGHALINVGADGFINHKGVHLTFKVECALMGPWVLEIED